MSNGFSSSTKINEEQTCPTSIPRASAASLAVRAESCRYVMSRDRPKPASELANRITEGCFASCSVMGTVNQIGFHLCLESCDDRLFG